MAEADAGADCDVEGDWDDCGDGEIGFSPARCDREADGRGFFVAVVGPPAPWPEAVASDTAVEDVRPPAVGCVHSPSSPAVQLVRSTVMSIVMSRLL
jgi:hypothetical protein